MDLSQLKFKELIGKLLLVYSDFTGSFKSESKSRFPSQLLLFPQRASAFPLAPVYNVCVYISYICNAYIVF